MSNVVSMHGSLELRTSDFQSGMERAARAFEKQAEAMRRQIQMEMRQARESVRKEATQIEGIATKLGGTIRTMGLAAAAALGVGSVGAALKLADNYNQLEQRIRTATKATGDFEAINRQLFQTAIKHGASFEGTVSAFQKMALGAKHLGATNKDIVVVIDSIQKVGELSRSTGEQTIAVYDALSKTLTQNKMEHREWRAIMQNMPELAYRIASGLGVSVDQMKELVKEGQVTSKDVFKTLISQNEQLREEWEQLPVTLASATQSLQDSSAKFIADLDKAFGVSQRLADTFDGMAKAIAGIGDSITKWANTPITFAGTQTTQGKLLTQRGSALSSLVHRGLNAFGLGELQPLARAVGLDPVGLEAAKEFKRKQAEKRATEAQAKAEHEAQMAAHFQLEGVKKGSKGKTFDELLAKEVQITREYQLRSEHRKEEAAMAEALFKIESGLNRKLSESEKDQVRRTVAQREGYKQLIEDEKKAQQEAAKRAAELERIQQQYQDMGASLDAQLEVERIRARLGEYQADQAERRFKFEQHIKNMSSEQKADLLQKFDAAEAAAEEAAWEKKLTAMANETALLEKQASVRQEERPLIAELNKLKEQGRLTAERELELGEKFNAKVKAEQNLRAKDYIRNLEEQTQQMAEQEQIQDLVSRGMHQQAGYLREILQFQRQVNRAATDEERQRIATNTAQREWLRQYEQARGIIQSTRTEQERLNDKIRELAVLYQNGFLSLQQYQRAVADIDPRFQKIRDAAKEMGSALSNAFERLVFNGEKFKDVLKDIGLQLAKFAAQKFLFEPLTQGITNLATNFWQRFIPVPGLQQQGQLNPFATGGLAQMPGAPFTQMPGAPHMQPAGIGGALSAANNASAFGAPPGVLPVWIVGGGGSGGSMPLLDPLMRSVPIRGATVGGSSSTGGGGGMPFAPQNPLQARQMRDQLMRQQGQSILKNPNSSPLERSMAQLLANGSHPQFGAPVLWWNTVPPGGSFGGGPVGGTAGVGMFEADQGPQFTSNQLRERLLQEQRWARGGLTGAGGNLVRGPQVQHFNFGPGDPAPVYGAVARFVGSLTQNFSNAAGVVGAMFSQALQQMNQIRSAPWPNLPNGQPWLSDPFQGVVGRAVMGGVRLPVPASPLDNMWSVGPGGVRSFAGVPVFDPAAALRATRGYASGGRPSPGQIALVGEEGPELFVPDSAGTVVPLRPHQPARSEHTELKVVNYNYSGQPIRQEVVDTPRGRELHQWIGEVINAHFASGRADGAMAQRYGQKPRARH